MQTKQSPFDSAARRRRTSGQAPATTTQSTHHLQPRPALDPIRSVKRESIHWKRKVFHVIGIGTVGAAYLLTQTTGLQAFAIMLPIAVLFVFMDALRFWVPSLNKKVKKDFGPLMRDYELDGLSGSSWFFFSGLIALVAFPKLAAGMGIVFLAIGDPLASFVGVRWGRIKLPGKKSLEGSLALATLCSLVGTVILVGLGGLTLGTAVLVAVLSGIAAAFAEWLPIKKVDDNFTMPLVTGAVASLLLLAVGAA
jgi:dolichol kinase